MLMRLEKNIATGIGSCAEYIGGNPTEGAARHWS